MSTKIWKRDSTGCELIHTSNGRTAIIGENIGGGSWLLDCWDARTKTAHRRSYHYEPTTEEEARRLGEAWVENGANVLHMERVDVRHREDIAAWEGRTKPARGARAVPLGK